MRLFFLLLTACLLPLGLLACRSERWDVADEVRAPDHVVAAALGDLGAGVEVLPAEVVPDIRPPFRLRPCCAFGADLRVRVGAVPVPGVELGNLIDPGELGPHRYDAGLVSLDPKDNRGWRDQEVNGQIYTCRGGFIDLAHVRDYADMTLALAAQLGRTMDTGGSIPLPAQGAELRVVVEPVPRAALERHGRRELAAAGAEWLAFHHGVWHEIATWYGYASLAQWPEKISAFSPEDLYSNLIGIKIGGGVVRKRGSVSDREYERGVDAWIRRVLARLEALSREEGRAAMYSVDELWWDSTKRIPDWTLTRRRNMELGTRIEPWLVGDASPAEGASPSPFDGCPDGGEKLVLRNPDGFEGIPFEDYLRFEADVHDALAAEGFPFPREGERAIDQRDFAFVIEDIRRANAEEFGDGADRP